MMAQIKVVLSGALVDGMDIKFKAPCDCTEIDGLIVEYPMENDTTGSQEFIFKDAHGNDLTGIGNLFSKDAYVKVIVDTVNGFAYLQNADNNSFLHAAVLGTYTHSAAGLIGSGVNGKFKATESGSYSVIPVNGANCSVKCGEDSTIDLIAGCWYTFILDGSTINFNSGGTGAGLNFKVVGGTTEPVSPSENTIWVDTDVDISEWILSASEPDAPREGSLWLILGTSSRVAFNALKKNTLMVYPLAAKQYVDGAWVGVTARSMINGEWVEWIADTYLFVNGDTCDGITGGWTGIQGGVVQDDVLYLGCNGLAVGHVWTNQAVDVSGYSQLKITISETNDTVTAGLLVDAPTSDNYGNDNEGNALALASTTGNTLICDVSALSGKYYVWITRASGGGAAETHSAAIATVELVVQAANSGVAMLMLTNDTNTPVQAEIDGQSYGVGNATVNQEPTATTYDFTVL